jgi:hypothetical protein
MDKYIDTPKMSKPKKGSYNVISEMSTARILFYLFRKHKTAIFAVWAIAMTINWAIPQWPQFVGAALF